MVRRVGKGGRITLSEGALRYLLTYYPRMGPSHVAEKLGVSTTTVIQFGREYGVDSYTPPAGHTTVTDVAIDAGVTYRAVWEKADKDGVLARRGKRRGGARSASVPLSWAREYLAAMPEHTDAELIAAGWLSTPMFAEYIGVDETQARKYLGRLQRERDGEAVVVPYPATYFAHARIRLARGESMGGYKHMVYGPDVEEGRARWEADRHRASQLHDMRALAAMEGIDPHSMSSRLRRAGVEYEVLPNENRRPTRYYDLEVVRAAGVVGKLKP